MNAPIKREDIREGDRIRMVKEYTATNDHLTAAGPGTTYELIERPVQLPTEPGWYQGGSFLLSKGCAPYSLNGDGSWVLGGSTVTTEYMRLHAGELTLLRPVAEVAAEVLAEVRGSNMRNSELDAITDKWARA